jgi:hypothetical protein
MYILIFFKINIFLNYLPMYLLNLTYLLTYLILPTYLHTYLNIDLNLFWPKFN